MWIFLNNAFLSIVRKDCGPDELLVRARRRVDIVRVFPKAKVIATPRGDYRFRAIVPGPAITVALARAVRAIDYPNFKDSVRDRRLHQVCLRVWQASLGLEASP